MTDRELLKAFGRDHARETFRPFLQRYLPLVFSAARRQTQDDSQATEVTRAVFLALAYKGRKIPRRTVLAGWLFRATQLGCRKLRSQKRPGVSPRISPPPLPGLMPPPIPEEAPPLLQPAGDAVPSHPNTLAPELWSKLASQIDSALDRLPPKHRDAVLVQVFLGCSSEETERVLRASGKRVQKRVKKGLAKLSRRLRKSWSAATPEALAGVCANHGCGTVVPPGLDSEILSAVEQGLQNAPPNLLALRTLRAISWARWRRRLKVAAICVSVLLLLSTAAGLYGLYLWRTGRLMAWMIESSSSREAKSVPGLNQPARPWPTDSRPKLRAEDLRTPGDLYHITNLWSAHLKFSPDQWKAIEPRRIDPVPKIFQPDGVVILRNPKAQRSGLAGALGFDFNWVHMDIDFGGLSFQNAGARIKGNGTYLLSLYGRKRSFKVDLNKFMSGQQIGGVEEINFTNLIDDRSYMSDALGYEFFREAGVPAPRTAYAWLNSSVTGKWEQKPLGLYLLVENLGSAFAAERFGSKKTPIFKPVTYQLFQDLGDDWSAYADIYDLKTKATAEQRHRVMEFSQLVSHADDQEFEQRLAEFLDLDEFARFLAALVLLSSYDGFLSDGQNFYVYLDPKFNKFGFMPWDLDHAWGAFYLIGRAEERERASIWHPWVGRNRFLERVMAVKSFRKIYRRHLETLLSTLFVPERLSRRIDEIAQVVRDPIGAESTLRLQWFEQAVGDKWVPPPHDAGRAGPNRPVHQLKHFIEQRAKSVRQQLDGKSKGVNLGRAPLTND